MNPYKINNPMNMSRPKIWGIVDDIIPDVPPTIALSEFLTRGAAIFINRLVIADLNPDMMGTMGVRRHGLFVEAHGRASL